MRKIKILDNSGVAYLYSKLKTKFVQQESGKGLSTEDFTTAEKTKLSGIEANANNYTLPVATANTLGGFMVGSGLSMDNGVLSSTGGGSGDTIKTTLDSVLMPCAKYYLGQQSSVSLVLPTNAALGSEITVCFSSGSTACQLTCDLEDFDFVPKANKTTWIKFILVVKGATSSDDKWLIEVKEG